MANVPYSNNMVGHGHISASASSPVFLAKQLKNITNIVAAGLSLTLIAGVGFWGYKLMIRDVTGLPVVRAINGEMRVLPNNPGGDLAPNQGLSVNEIAASGTSLTSTDTLVLAPKPVTLAVEDTPVASQMVALSQQPLSLDLSATNSNGTVVAEVTPTTLETGNFEDLVRQLAQETNSSNNIAGANNVRVEATVASTNLIENSLIQAAGLRQSLRPLLRPAMAPAVFVPVSTTTKRIVVDVDPVSLPAGTRLVQLGAFDSAEIARIQWNKIEDRFGDFFLDKSRIVQKTNSGGRTFYRLRAMGFVDLSDARRFCSTLLADKVDCIPVVTR